MQRASLRLGLLLLPLLSSPGLAQSLEGTIGLAHRSDAQGAPPDGVHSAIRLGTPLTRGLHLITGASWTRFDDQRLAYPATCTLSPAGCTGLGSVPGLGMASLGLGLQSVIPLAGVELRPSALVSGYWLYHRPSNQGPTAAGTDLGLGLGLPVGTRSRILLEARWVHLFGSSGNVGSSRRIGVGVALN